MRHPTNPEALDRVLDRVLQVVSESEGRYKVIDVLRVLTVTGWRGLKLSWLDRYFEDDKAPPKDETPREAAVRLARQIREREAASGRLIEGREGHDYEIE